MKIVDLRRDTITLPTPAMVDAAFKATLGDSVYGEDPNQVQLETFAAEILGKEDSIFVPSGTMGNLIALLTHTSRGDELICEENAHIRISETGGGAMVGGLMFRGIEDPSGIPDVSAVESAIRADDIHYPRTSLICTEITHYRYGGIIPPLKKVTALYHFAQKKRIPVHCDGARLFNAAVALNIDVRELTSYADSVMVSLSKGLGAPVGSILAGQYDFIEKAKRFRKMLGGGMRQTGWLAACGIVALQKENIQMLKEDHQNAIRLAQGLSSLPGIKIDFNQVQTNFILVDIAETGFSGRLFLDKLKDKGVLVTLTKPTVIRMVTSRVVNQHDIEYAIEIIGRLLQKL